MPARWTRPIIALIAVVAVLMAPVGGLGPAARAQEPCAPEAEPNDAPESAVQLGGPVCVEGTLPADDQDIVLWELPAADAATLWTMAVTGIRGTLTELKVLPILSEPGVTPLEVGSALTAVSSNPGDVGPVTVRDVLLPPGRFVLGISRSGREDGSEPFLQDYRFSIEAGQPMPPGGDVEPNDRADQASPVAGPFSVSGDLGATSDYVAWTVPDAGGQAWTLRARGAIGTPIALSLYGEDGTTLAFASARADGTLTLPDLRLEPATYLVYLSVSAGPSYPYTLEAFPVPPVGDAEPNDFAQSATPLDLAAGPASGRIGYDGDRDYYRLTVAPDAASSLHDIRLISQAGQRRRLCLMTVEEVALQCQDSADGIRMQGLLLSPGDYLLALDGDTDRSPGDGYVLRTDRTTPPAVDYEAEPDDAPAMATAWDPAITMRGRGGPSDSDVFRLSVQGEPQLWEVEATGTAIGRLAWIKADTTFLAEADIAPAADSALLTDLYLVPGEHWLRLDSGGEYQLRATALGPPDPDAEHEPNNDPTFAEPYRLSRQRVVGRLPSSRDADVFQFSLAAPERLTLRAEPPADGAIDVMVTSMRQTIGSLRAPALGQPTVLELRLPPGDYEAWLRPGTPSRGRYDFSIARGDPFAIVDDDEPNDDAAHASRVGGTLTLKGSGPPGGEFDWYLLPEVAEGAVLAVRTNGAVHDAVVSDGVTDLVGTFESSAATLTGAPTGSLTTEPVVGTGPRYLRITATGPYVARVAADGLEPSAVADPLPVRLGLRAAASEVAAYWPSGQGIDAVLSLSNDGTSTQTVHLDTLASHFAWSASPASPTVSLLPGQTVEVPVAIRAGADAWADDPVRVSVRARNAAGAQQTAFVEVTPRSDAEPVNPEEWWPVPDGLLGGLDVASLALGGAPVAPIDPVAEAQLHDGLTIAGLGLASDRTLLPITLTVDLAGDDPVPVAGTILNPQAGDGLLSDVPRAFELLLSTDGVSWQRALRAEMSTLAADQAFLLDEPIDAAYAQLRIESVHGGDAGSDVNLGEWKVIAAPGAAPSTQGLNLADPVGGGHVAWMEPQQYDPYTAQGLLLDDGTAQTIDLEARTPISWAVGFRDGRAAQVTELQWADPVPSNPGSRLNGVDVSISLDGPSGPWREAGTWDLERAADGTVAPFAFAEPTWARFLRFHGAGPKREEYAFELPAALRVIERPTDDGYRSILGEWGAASPRGPWEWSQPPDLSVAPPAGPDGNDSPAAAEPLQFGVPTAGRVSPEVDVDWYEIAVPEGHNTLEFQVRGRPIVAVALTLIDADELQVPMLFGPGDGPGSVEYSAEVTPGSTYRVEVVQPPSSTVFAYDTSLSIWGFFPYVVQGLRSFTADVTAGEEAVKIVPFEEPALLDDWSDRSYELLNAIDRYVNAGSSSSAEAALIDAATELSGREGARAILVVTDAETSSFARSAEMWRILESVRPLVFAVHIGGSGEPALSTALMQDWSRVADGFYQYARSHGEMNRAFDRLATWLRRPAGYVLTAATTFEERPTVRAKPGTVAVTPPAEGDVAATIDPRVGVEIILDTSGSMLARERGTQRIDLAKANLADLVTQRLPAGAPVAVRVLGDRTDVCGTRLAVPLAPLDPAAVLAEVEAIEVDQEADTAIGAAIRAVPDDLAGSTGTRIVLLITDSEEIWPHPDLCGTDPGAAIRLLRRRGIDARLNIVGLAVDSRKARNQLRRWASLGDGSFFLARDQRQLARSIQAAVSAPFRVLDGAGNEVASGTVGGSPTEVPPGTYSVVVLTDPVSRFDGVQVEPEGAVALRLHVPEAPQPDEPAAAAP